MDNKSPANRPIAGLFNVNKQKKDKRSYPFYKFNNCFSKAMSQTMTDFLKLIKYFILSLKYGLDTSKSRHFVNFCKGAYLPYVGIAKIYK